MQSKRSGSTVQVSVVRFEQGDEWARFETKDGSSTALFTNSAGVRVEEMGPIQAACEARACMAAGWERIVSGATLPAWAA